MYNIMNIMTIMTYVIAHMMYVERPGGMREMIDPDGSRDWRDWRDWVNCSAGC